MNGGTRVMNNIENTVISNMRQITNARGLGRDTLERSLPTKVHNAIAIIIPANI